MKKVCIWSSLAAGLVLAFAGGLFLGKASCSHSAEGDDPEVGFTERHDIADLQKKTEVFYLPGDGSGKKVKLSQKMAAKIIAITSEKPKPWTKGAVKALPRGSILVGKQKYDLYGFIAFEIDSSWGHSWSDDSLTKFWQELNRVGEEYDKLQDFKP